jgi:hypothetical protein
LFFFLFCCFFFFFFFFFYHCLSFCPFSFGHFIVCPFDLRFLLIPFVSSIFSFF